MFFSMNRPLKRFARRPAHDKQRDSSVFWRFLKFMKYAVLITCIGILALHMINADFTSFHDQTTRGIAAVPLRMQLSQSNMARLYSQDKSTDTLLDEKKSMFADQYNYKKILQSMTPRVDDYLSIQNDHQRKNDSYNFLAMAVPLNGALSPVDLSDIGKINVPLNGSIDFSGPRNLVLGIAVDMDPKSFAIFCGSLRAVFGTTERNGHDRITDAIIFMNAPASAQNMDIARRHSIIIIEYAVQRLEPIFLRTYHPSSLRWILFYRLLMNEKMRFTHQYNNILFADVRDTFFQRDPFEYARNGAFRAFAESDGRRISDCGWNSGWVRDCFGDSVLQLVAQQTVICSGISLAGRVAAVEYLGIMGRILMGESVLGAKFPHCEKNGVDQGVHNVIMHLGLLSTETVVETESTFPVVHLQSSLSAGAFDLYRKTFVSSGDYPDGLAVVHQYDRIHSLQLALGEQFVTWVNFSDANSNWKSEPACRKYFPVGGTDLLTGQCDYGTSRSMSAVDCCKVCNDRSKPAKTCLGFAFSDGVCYLKSCAFEDVMVQNLRIQLKYEYQNPQSEVAQSAATRWKDSMVSGGLVSAYRTDFLRL